MGIIENRDAQFMLLASFIIAIGLVITTVMLGSVIFEFNMAIGAGNEFSKNDMVNLMIVSKDGVRSAYRNATELGGNDSQMNFSNQIRNFSANLQKSYVLHGEIVNLSQDISNWNNSRLANFTDNGTASGATNWTIMESARGIYVFELRNVSGSYFEVNVSNQSTSVFLWSMKLNSPNNISIKNASGFVRYYGVNYSNISLLNGSYNFTTNVGANITRITFLNGSNAGGRFKIIGNTSYGRNFTRARDYILNATVILSTSKIRANITIPISVPW
ncbi:MAG: hypothetical protein O8C66_08025 [Candidatus Methanoperedens sp.]|nr:hypothetical protein [Candidatus Methanoperedens sp.]MCZ7370443.1 hypothetical protein [Candidatus Methanoperedens sp.]